MSESETVCCEYLLFSELNFDFKAALPIDLGNGVQLARPDAAYWAIDHSDDPYANGLHLNEGSRVTALLTPERFVGAGEVHVCLAKQRPLTLEMGAVRDDLFTALLALRLVKPVAYDLRAALTVEGTTISDEGRYLDQSGYNPADTRSFGSAELERCGSINRRLASLRVGRGCRRFRSALTYFGQVTMGFVGSRQLAMLGLFAALDGMFPHPGKRCGNRQFDGKSYGPRLASRVVSFLCASLTTAEDESWLSDLYTERRNGLAHGADFLISPPQGRPRNLPPSGSDATIATEHDFGRLHELVRLCALGMLGLCNSELRVLLPEDADVLGVQRRIDSTSAPTRFLKPVAQPSRR